MMINCGCSKSRPLLVSSEILKKMVSTTFVPSFFFAFFVLLLLVVHSSCSLSAFVLLFWDLVFHVSLCLGMGEN